MRVLLGHLTIKMSSSLFSFTHILLKKVRGHHKFCFCFLNHTMGLREPCFTCYDSDDESHFCTAGGYHFEGHGFGIEYLFIKTRCKIQVLHTFTPQGFLYGLVLKKFVKELAGRFAIATHLCFLSDTYLRQYPMYFAHRFLTSIM